MQPQAYIDLRVVPSFKSERPNAMAHDIMALLIKFTHAIAAKQAFKHGVAFPQAKVGARPSPGNHARVFALEKSSLEALADELEKQRFVRDYVSIGRIKALASDYQPPAHVEYLRFRVPNRKSRLEESRARRMAEDVRAHHCEGRQGGRSRRAAVAASLCVDPPRLVGLEYEQGPAPHRLSHGCLPASDGPGLLEPGDPPGGA